jgi:hypothetical protein
MTVYRPLGVALAMLLLLAMAFPQGQAQRPPTPEEAAVTALQQEYQRALQEYQRPLVEARTDEERRQVRLDPAKHPGREFLPRFRELATRYARTPAGLQALIQGRAVALQLGDAPAGEQMLETMLADHGSTPAFAAYVLRMPAPPPAPGERPTAELMNAKIEELLVKVEARTTHPEVRGAVLLRRAFLHRNDPDRALALYREIDAKYGPTEAAKTARAAIFEAENLVEGKVAPDFEATDAYGEKFQLSDYRGKVVVLEFWGFW